LAPNWQFSAKEMKRESPSRPISESTKPIGRDIEHQPRMTTTLQYEGNPLVELYECIHSQPAMYKSLKRQEIRQR